MCYQIELPEEFKSRMKDMLPESVFQDFLDSYNKERSYGLRCNPLKWNKESFAEDMPFSLKKVSWADEGYYYEAEEQPGKHVFHEMGAYYIQEPSAMSVVQKLDPKPGERVLDLCAAPGGKSTQIAGRLRGEGILVANEIVPNRSKILSQNIERMGVANCIVTNESPEHLAKFFPVFFDKIVVDAPCSGEGMFRKDPEALRQWSTQNVLACAKRQDMILEYADTMLRSGGTICYSTCTFSEEEDEGTVQRFLEKHSEYTVEEQERFWPHEVDGEGHFVVKLRKAGKIESEPYILENLKGDKKQIHELDKFFADELKLDFGQMKGEIASFGDQIYLVPMEAFRLKGMKVERPGLHIAVSKKGRFEPAHALGMAIDNYVCGKKTEVSLEQAAKFVSGESINIEDSALKGWCIPSVKGCSVGIAKATNGVLKNHYPKGLRRNVIF